MAMEPRFAAALTASHQRRRTACVWVVGCILFLGSLHSLNAATRADERSVIATFLLHFAQFTTWPDSAFSNSKAPCVLGVLGEDPFGERLEEVFRGETIRGRSVVVKRLGSELRPEDCHLLFVGDLDETRFRRAMEILKGRAVLTLSTRPRFCDEGGMIGFETDRGKLIFFIRREAVRESGLSIHSRLLNMARTPTGSGQP